LGVVVTNDGGKSWAVLGDALPHVAVFSLAFQRKTRTLVAATHGRSVWKTVFGPATIAASPASLSFTMTAGDAAPAPASVSIADGEPYGSSLAFAVAPDAEW